MIKVLSIEEFTSSSIAILAVILRSVFENVEWIRDGVTAISRIQEWQPNLVVMDEAFIHTEELMKQFHSVYSGISIGIISGRVEKPDDGCDFYVYKPIDLDKFSPFLNELAKKLTENDVHYLRRWLSEKQPEFREAI